MMNLTLELYSNLIPLKLDEIYILLLNLYSLIEINIVYISRKCLWKLNNEACVGFQVCWSIEQGLYEI